MAGVPDNVRVVPYDTPAAIRELSTARVWVDNCRKGAHVKKDGQYYMQTWHGFALKRIERDVADKLNTPENAAYAEYAKRDSAQIDAIISNSTFMTEIYQKSFWYHGAVLEYGSARNDILVHPPADAKQQVQQALHLPNDCQIIMYAPTFRADHSFGCLSAGLSGRVPCLCAALRRQLGDAGSPASKRHEARQGFEI